MDFNILISELRSSSELLPTDAEDKSLLSSEYCKSACKALRRVTEFDGDYDSIITGLWLIVAHFAEQTAYLRPVPALSELCFKLFRQCSKAVLNIQWQNLDEESSVRQNFLVSLANLHEKLVPFDFLRFHLLETLTENPWTNPTLAKIMGGEVEPSDKEEVHSYIEQEDPIILQLRVDMMLKENCEEYALNLCTSCLIHPELATDLGLHITQLSLLYKMGHEEKLQEECQKLSIQDALRLIKELNTSGHQKELYTVLAQTFMVQNWIRPCDTETSKELLRMWIRHQLLVDEEHDQFKDSIWAMAKLSHSTEQIVIIINVLREECGDTFLQLYVDMSIFAVKVDKGQMETSIKDGNMEAAAARRADMASVCAKLSCLCHNASLKVARICVLTSFALKPTDESFTKIGVFYGQGGDCCDKCEKDNKHEAGTVNPATLYEVERLLNMLRPEYLNPDNTYPQVHMLCRKFLLESLKNIQQTPKKQSPTVHGTVGLEDMAITQVEGPGKKKGSTNKATLVFEALSQQDVQSRQMLLNKLRRQNVGNITFSSPPSTRSSSSHHTSIVPSNRSKGLLSTQSGHLSGPGAQVQMSKLQSGRHQQQLQQQQQQELYLNRLQQHLEKQGSTVNLAQSKGPNSQVSTQLQQQQQTYQTQQVSQIIQTALRKDPNALQQFSKTQPAAVVQAIVNIMKGSTTNKPAQKQNSQQQMSNSSLSSPLHGDPSLPTVSTLLRPPSSSTSPSSTLMSSQVQMRQPQQRKYPRPQLYAQPIIVSTAASSNTSLPYSRYPSQSSSSAPAQANQSVPMLSSNNPSGALPTPAQLRRAESLNMTKAQFQGVRQFMQSHVMTLPQRQHISVTNQMSGATVTVNTSGSDSSSSLSHAHGSSSTRDVMTTVEMAQQASIARELKKQQGKQVRHGQQTSFPGGQAHPGSGQSQVIGTINRSNIKTSHLPGSQQHLRQQPSPRHLIGQQSSSNIFTNVDGSFHNSQPAASVSVPLPSSDELLGSITGIDDTIINDLLKESGLLANTFPDIEVDISAEEKIRKSVEISLASNSAAPSANQSPTLLPRQAYSKSGPGYPSISSSIAMTSSIIHPSTPGHTVMVKTEVGSVKSENTLVPQHSQMNQQLRTMSAPNSRFSSDSQQQQMYSLPPQAVVPAASSSTHNQNLNQQNPLTVSAAEQARVDQIKEQMKQEDIPGEMCMDASNNATYRCIICSLAFETLDLLREHVRNVCKPGLQSSSVYTSKIEQDKANSARAGLETTTVFQCLRCFELCISEAGIKQHRLTCKRVPTVPSDLKKDTSSSTTTKSKSSHKASSSNKQQAAIRTESGSGISRTQNKNNASILSSHPPKMSNSALPNTTGGAGAAVTLGTKNAHSLVKTEPQNSYIASPGPVLPVHTVATPQVSNTLLQHTSNTSLSHTPIKPTIGMVTSLSAKVPAISQAPASVNSVIPGASSLNCSVKPAVEFKPDIGVQEKCMLNQGKTMEFQQAGAKHVQGTISKLPNVPSFILQPKKEPTAVAKTKDTPSFSEISGSGGRKLYKCNLCAQTLCSATSFIDHWKGCSKVSSKKKMGKEKKTPELLTGSVLKNVLDVIESVASGNVIKPEVELKTDPHEDVVKLKDPCSEATLDSVSSSVDGESSEISWNSRFDNSTDSELDKKFKINQGEVKGNKGTTPCNKNVGRRKCASPSSSETGKDTGKGSKKANMSKNGAVSDDGHDDDEDDGEEDASASGSESGSMTLRSTRDAPPQLRDRKLLKPIQSFINETFVSPYQHTNKSLGKVLEENTVSEGTTSGAESDEDQLLCKVCKTSFQTKRILLQHYVGKHLHPFTVKTVSDSSSYFCHLCQKTFSTFMHYMQHIPNHSKAIAQKMKTYAKSLRSTQHSARIANQRGLEKAKKSSLSPKLAKALKSKKAAAKSAVNRMKRQMLASRGQTLQERLGLSNKRQKTMRLTSSEDDYSSDASNLMFRSRKRPTMLGRATGGKLSRRRRTRSRKDTPGNTAAESQLETEESQQASTPNTADEDYVASEEINSDTSVSISPPSTRSRKRSGNSGSPQSGDSKRRRHFSDSERLKLNSRDGDKSATFLSDFDTDSNSTTISVSLQDNGCFISAGAKLLSKTANNEADKSVVESNCPKSLWNRLTVRALSRTQKERLKSCNLNPSVVLDALNLDNVLTPSPLSIVSEELSSDSAKGSTDLGVNEHINEFNGPADQDKRPTFLDSYLKYISNYPQPNKKKAMKSSDHAPERQSISPSLERSVVEHEKNIAMSSSISETQQALTDHDQGGKNLPAAPLSFPVRRCSVNLGQKVSLDNWKPEEENNEAEVELGILKIGQPVVYLERSAVAESCIMSDSASSTIVEDSNSSESLMETHSNSTITNVSSTPPGPADGGPEGSSLASSVCHTMEEEDENDVLILEDSEEEGELKDMIIVVNKDVSDDGNDDDGDEDDIKGKETTEVAVSDMPPSNVSKEEEQVEKREDKNSDVVVNKKQSSDVCVQYLDKTLCCGDLDAHTPKTSTTEVAGADANTEEARELENSLNACSYILNEKAKDLIITERDNLMLPENKIDENSVDNSMVDIERNPEDTDSSEIVIEVTGGCGQNNAETESIVYEQSKNSDALSKPRAEIREQCPQDNEVEKSKRKSCIKQCQGDNSAAEYQFSVSKMDDETCKAKDSPMMNVNQGRHPVNEGIVKESVKVSEKQEFTYTGAASTISGAQNIHGHSKTKNEGTQSSFEEQKSNISNEAYESNQCNDHYSTKSLGAGNLADRAAIDEGEGRECVTEISSMVSQVERYCEERTALEGEVEHSIDNMDLVGKDKLTLSTDEPQEVLSNMTKSCSSHSDVNQTNPTVQEKSGLSQTSSDDNQNKQVPQNSGKEESIDGTSDQQLETCSTKEHNQDRQDTIISDVENFITHVETMKNEFDEGKSATGKAENEENINFRNPELRKSNASVSDQKYCFAISDQVNNEETFEEKEVPIDSHKLSQENNAIDTRQILSSGDTPDDITDMQRQIYEPIQEDKHNNPSPPYTEDSDIVIVSSLIPLEPQNQVISIPENSVSEDSRDQLISCTQVSIRCEELMRDGDAKSRNGQEKVEEYVFGASNGGIQEGLQKVEINMVPLEGKLEASKPEEKCEVNCVEGDLTTPSIKKENAESSIDSYHSCYKDKAEGAMSQLFNEDKAEQNDSAANTDEDDKQTRNDYGEHSDTDSKFETNRLGSPEKEIFCELELNILNKEIQDSDTNKSVQSDETCESSGAKQTLLENASFNSLINEKEKQEEPKSIKNPQLSLVAFIAERLSTAHVKDDHRSLECETESWSPKTPQQQVSNQIPESGSCLNEVGLVDYSFSSEDSNVCYESQSLLCGTSDVDTLDTVTHTVIVDSGNAFCPDEDAHMATDSSNYGFDHSPVGKDEGHKPKIDESEQKGMVRIEGASQCQKVCENYETASVTKERLSTMNSLHSKCETPMSSADCTINLVECKDEKTRSHEEETGETKTTCLDVAITSGGVESNESLIHISEPLTSSSAIDIEISDELSHVKKDITLCDKALSGNTSGSDCGVSDDLSHTLIEVQNQKHGSVTTSEPKLTANDIQGIANIPTVIETRSSSNLSSEESHTEVEKGTNKYEGEPNYCSEEGKDVAESSKEKDNPTLSESDTEDGDDLSHFELVIEKDTSSRSILTFPEKSRESLLKNESKAPQRLNNSAELQKGSGGVRGTATKNYYNPSPMKVLSGAKSLRKDGPNQFVWDEDGDGDIPFSPAPILSGLSKKSAMPVTQRPEHPGKRKFEEVVQDPGKRKWKALREKTKTAPFTWDLEESSEKNIPRSSSPTNTCFLKDSIKSKLLTLTTENHLSGDKRHNPIVTSMQEAQRPGSLRLVKRGNQKEENDKYGKCVLIQQGSVKNNLKPSNTEDSMKTKNDNIQVDEEISFKRDSLPSTPTEAHLIVSPDIKTKKLGASGCVRGRGRRRLGNTSTSVPNALTVPSLTTETLNVELTAKRQLSVRSRHNSVESNRSDTPLPVGSQVSRRTKDRSEEPRLSLQELDTSSSGSTQMAPKRKVKGEEISPSSVESCKSNCISEASSQLSSRRKIKNDEPLLKKAGLIKVGNSGGSLQVGQSTCSLSHNPVKGTPKTRSSEAAKKAYNQKSLRNRGVGTSKSAKAVLGSTPVPRQKATDPVSARSKSFNTTPTSNSPKNTLTSSKACLNQKKVLPIKSQVKLTKRKSDPVRLISRKVEIVDPKLKPSKKRLSVSKIKTVPTSRKTTNTNKKSSSSYKRLISGPISVKPKNKSASKKTIGKFPERKSGGKK